MAVSFPTNQCSTTSSAFWPMRYSTSPDSKPFPWVMSGRLNSLDKAISCLRANSWPSHSLGSLIKVWSSPTSPMAVISSWYSWRMLAINFTCDGVFTFQGWRPTAAYTSLYCRAISRVHLDEVKSMLTAIILTLLAFALNNTVSSSWNNSSACKWQCTSKYFTSSCMQSPLEHY